MRSRKRPCQPKTAKRIFGGPGSHGPSGQAKERTRILPVRRGSFCPACRAIWQAGRSCAASRFCAGLCDRCPGVCSLLHLAAGREACCNRVRLLRRCFPAHTPPAAFAPGLRCPPGACLSFVRCAQRAQDFCCFSRAAHGKLFLFLPVFRGFVPRLRASLSAAVVAAFARGVCLPSVRLWMRVFHLSFAFSCLAVAAQTSFHLSLRPRRGFSFLLASCGVMFRPAGLVTCCFFAGFCAHCLFACRALCFGCLFICLCCLHGFSPLFFLPFPA